MGEWTSILVSPGVGLIYVTRAMSWLGRTMLLQILPLFVATLMPESDRVSTFTGLVAGLAAATGTASAVYLGRLGDRIGHRQVLVGSAMIGGLFYIGQFFVTQPWQLLLLQALTGAAIGGVTPALSALLNNYTQPGQEGAVYGLDSSVAAAARAVAPLIGTGIAIWIGLPGAFAMAGLCFLLTAAIAIRWLPDYKALLPSQTVRTA
jgi:DHA1 family multidrug resistance protein-like MFS transporter